MLKTTPGLMLRAPDVHAISIRGRFRKASSPIRSVGGPQSLIRDQEDRRWASFEAVEGSGNSGYAARVYRWWSPPTRGSETTPPFSTGSTSRPCGGRWSNDW